MQLMQSFLLRLNVFPKFYGLLGRRPAIYTTRIPVETITPPGLCIAYYKSKRCNARFEHYIIINPFAYFFNRSSSIYFALASDEICPA